MHCQHRLALMSGHAALETLSSQLSTASTWTSDAQQQLTQLISSLQTQPLTQDATPPGAPPEHPDADLFEPCTDPGPNALGMFAGYRVLERIASGGMGLVYRAWDPTLGRVVALKLLRPALAASADSRTRFSREARAAAAVVHDHVVAIHAVGEERGLPYIVMGLIHGKSLEQRLQCGPIPIDQVLRIGAQTARGLAAAHAQGLVHRDIKPSNILLENSIERVKLVDFGLAHATDDTRLTREGMMAGTPEFMAPEQVRGEKVTAAADQFSLGCVLFACIRGTSPFHTDNTLATLRKISDQPAPSLLPHPHPFAPWLNSILQRLLAKDPQQRFPNMEKVSGLLESGLKRLQSGAPPPGSLTTGSPSPKKTKTNRLLAAAFALTVLITFATLFPNKRKTPPLASPTPPANSPAFRIQLASGQPNASFASLQDAVDAAQDGDIILLRVNGDIVLQNPLRLGKRRITLRSEPGFTPTLTSSKTLFALVISEGALQLEGLEFRGPGQRSDHLFPGQADSLPPKPSVAAQRGEIPHRLVAVIGGSLDARYCRFIAPLSAESFQDCLGLESCISVKLDHCEFYNAAGAILTWRFRNPAARASLASKAAPPQILFSDCFAYTKEGFLVAPNQADPGLWIIENSTVISLNLFRLLSRSEHVIGITNCILAHRTAVISTPRNVQLSEVIRGSSSSNLFLGGPFTVGFRALAQFDPSSLGPLPFENAWKSLGSRLQQSHKLPLRPPDFDLLPSDTTDWPQAAFQAWKEKGARLQKIGPGKAWSEAFLHSSQQP